MAVRLSSYGALLRASLAGKRLGSLDDIHMFIPGQDLVRMWIAGVRAGMKCVSGGGIEANRPMSNRGHDERNDIE